MAGINKLLGYVSSALGIAALATSSVPAIAAKIPLPVSITGLPLTIAGGVLVAIGIFFLLTSGSSGKGKQITEEVPIYQGDKIVGYRKAGK